MKRNQVTISALLLIGLLAAAWIGLAGFSFTPNSQPVGYVGQPAVSAFAVPAGGTVRVFRGSYNLNNWAGNVHSFPMGADGNIAFESQDWDAGDSVGAQHYDTGRIIVTRKPNGTAVPFRWASLDATQQAAISANATTGGQIVNFIRGDRSNEAPNGVDFRKRVNVFGSVIHSSVQYVAADDTLYVGANDGMLHALDGNTGEERFAYVPTAVYANLKNMVADPFVFNYFVDGNIAIERVLLDGDATRVLVGTLGAGGKSVFALDITDASPADEAAAVSMVKWEITNESTGFANLGYTFASPVIARLNYAVSGTQVPAAIIANGYMNSGNGKGALFIVNLDTGALIQELVTSSDSGTVAAPNGLSSPLAYDVDGDGTVDRVYAGDLEGNLWRFDLSSTNTAAWTSTKVFTTDGGQPITNRPVAQIHPLGGYMVTFGTGKALGPSDLTSTDTHYAYGIWDGAPVANTLMQTQTLTRKTYGGSLSVRTVSDNEVCYSACPSPTPATTLHKGWKTELPGGERLLGDGGYYSSGRFVFTSTNPTVNNGAGQETGENWLNQLDFLTGGATSTLFFDLNGDTVVNSADRLEDAEGDLDMTFAGVAASRILDADLSQTGIQLGGFPSQPVVVRLPLLDQPIFTVGPTSVLDTPPPTEDRGVSGGHFDVDLYAQPQAGSSKSTYTPIPPTATPSVCAKSGDVSKAVGTLYASCPAASKLLTGFTNSGSSCGKGGVTTITLACSAYTAVTESLPTYSYTKHFHEYDDLYDVTGVNFLLPSSGTLKLSLAVTDVTTNFKVLAYNQYHSPAVQFKLGPSASYGLIRNYGNLTTDHSADLNAMLTALSTYNRGDVGNMVFNLPLDAFQSKDWAGDGNARAGLIPTQTGCVNKSLMSTPGKLGEPHNGAITWQVVKSSTPGSAVQMNVAGRPDLGYRLKNDQVVTYLLAEYTVFWHHPNGFCYNVNDWVDSPEQDTESSGKASTPDAGSDDPKDGAFDGEGDAGGITITVETVGNQVIITTRDEDGNIISIETQTTDADGVVTSVTCTGPGADGTWGNGDDVCGPPVEVGGSTSGGAGQTTQEAAGRRSWRDLGE